MRIYLDTCCYNRRFDNDSTNEFLVEKRADAYHIASAILSECDYFLTFDKKILRYDSEEVKIINPVEFFKIWSDKNAETD